MDCIVGVVSVASVEFAEAVIALETYAQGSVVRMEVVRMAASRMM